LIIEGLDAQDAALKQIGTL